MSNLTLRGDPSGGGTVTLSAPNTSSSYTVTLPSAATTLIGTTGGGALTLGTAQNSTSGTSIDFTGIPSWVKRVTVIFNGVSLSAGSSFLVQLGAGSVVTTGYTSTSSGTNNSNLTSTAGMVVAMGAAASGLTGHMVITSMNTSGAWVSSHQAAIGAGPSVLGGASITLGGALDRLRITTVSGTDTFDAGTINIMYEG
jgi:hypothetical protein